MNAFNKLMANMNVFKENTKPMALAISGLIEMIGETKKAAETGLALATSFIPRPERAMEMMLMHPEHCVEISTVVAECVENLKVVKTLKKLLDEQAEESLSKINDFLMTGDPATLKQREISTNAIIDLLNSISASNMSVLSNMKHLAETIDITS